MKYDFNNGYKWLHCRLSEKCRRARELMKKAGPFAIFLAAHLLSMKCENDCGAAVTVIAD